MWLREWGVSGAVNRRMSGVASHSSVRAVGPQALLRDSEGALQLADDMGRGCSGCESGVRDTWNDDSLVRMTTRRKRDRANECEISGDRALIATDGGQQCSG